VRVTVIALALDLDLDYLCFMRPAPHFSYRNPVERCFSLGNLLLQHMSLARPAMAAEFENLFKGCNSMKAARLACRDNLELKVGRCRLTVSKPGAYTRSLSSST